MNKALFALAVMSAVIAAPAHAVVAITTPTQTYAQDFNTLSAATSNTANQTWANDSTLPGWFLFNRANGTAATTYRADNGSSNTGYFFSYGSNGTAERALGSVGSSNATGYWGTVSSGSVAGYIALALMNNTGSAVTDFVLQYDGEQWRDGGNNPAVAQSMTVQYGIGDTFTGVTTWNNLADLTFTSPTFKTTAAALDGNAAANRAAGLWTHVTPAGWNQGSTLWVRWVEVNDQGSDHGLAIDNVQLTVGAVPEPQTYAMMLAGLVAIGFMASRRIGR